MSPILVVNTLMYLIVQCSKESHSVNMLSFAYYISFLLHFFYLQKCESVTVDDFTTIEVEIGPDSKSCLFVSNEPIWPFEDSDFTLNYAQEKCKELGMDLADIENDLEKTALQELTSMR